MGKLQNKTVAWGNIQLDDYEKQWTATLTIVHCWESGVEGSGFLDLFIGDECMNLGEAYHVDSDDISDYITRGNIEEWLKMIFWQGDEIKAFKLEKIKYDKDYQGE